MKKKGVEITQQGFYGYKNIWKKAKGGVETPKAAAAANEPSKKIASGVSVLATLQKLEELAEEIGGYSELRKLIDFLEK